VQVKDGEIVQLEKQHAENVRMHQDLMLVKQKELSTLQTQLDKVHSVLVFSPYPPLFPPPSARQHPSYGDCLEVKREYYQNCSVLGCVTQCSQSAAYLNEQFLQVQQIGFVTLGPLRCA